LIQQRIYEASESFETTRQLFDFQSSFYLGIVLKSSIEEEVEISNVLESTIFGHKKYDFFRTNIEFKNFKQ